MRWREIHAVGIALTLAGCSTVMEANRPAAVNINQYKAGDKRIDTIAHLGAPLNTVKDGIKSCDFYKLYTKGTSKAGKAGIIFTEAAADVFTLGLAEALATPAEGATKSNTHTVLICYDANEGLVSIRDEGKVIPLAKLARVPRRLLYEWAEVFSPTSRSTT